MPRNTERPLNADEQRFIRHYVRERDIEKAERIARLRVGQGIKFYKRTEVRADIDRRIRDIEHEQAKLDAKDITRKVETLSELLDPELIKIIQLDPEKHGNQKLKALELGFVVSGRIRKGNTEALDRTVTPGTTSVPVYESVFTRQHAIEAAQPEKAAPIPAPQASAAKPVPTPPAPPTPPQKAKIRVY